MTNLDRLIEAVEDGDWGKPKDAFPDHKTHMLGFKAYHGSLDAAKALHEALLPGWRVAWLAEMLDRIDGWECRLTGPNPHQGEYATNAVAARSWLLAILKAYRSQINKA